MALSRAASESALTTSTSSTASSGRCRAKPGMPAAIPAIVTSSGQRLRPAGGGESEGGERVRVQRRIASRRERGAARALTQGYVEILREAPKQQVAHIATRCVHVGIDSGFLQILNHKRQNQPGAVGDEPASEPRERSFVGYEWRGGDSEQAALKRRRLLGEIGCASAEAEWLK